MANDAKRLIAIYEADISPYEKSIKRMEAVSDAAMEKQAAATEKLSKSIDGLNARTAQSGQVALKAANQNNILAGAAGDVAGSAAMGAAKLGLFAASLGLFPGRIGRFVRVIGAFRLAMIPAVAGVGALVGAGVKGIPVFAEWDRQMRTLAQVIRATGGAAGQSAADIEAMADRIAKSTLAADDAVREAAAQLLTFRAIAADSFERTLKAAQDLSAVGFGSVSQASVQLGKALEDPIRGLAALRRVGVSFSASQRAMIRNFVETGRTAEAQRVILAAVEGQVGGAGAAAAGGLSGAFHLLGETMEDWFELVGRKAADLVNLNSLLRGLAGGIAAVNKGMELAADPRAAAQRRLAELQGKRPTIATVDPMGSTGALARLDAEIATTERLIEGLDRLESARVAEANAAARRGREAAATERYDDEIEALAKQAEALRRSALEESQFQAVRRAGAEGDPERAARIRELVKANFDYEAATRAATAAQEAAQQLSQSQRETAADAIADLRFEAEQLGRTAEQQELYNNLKSAGVALESEYGRQIAGATAALQAKRAQIEATRLAQEQLNEAQRFFGDIAFQSLSSIIVRGDDAADAMRRLAASIADAALQAALLGTGPLAGLFGAPAAKGSVGGLFGAIAGLFHKGGIVGSTPVSARLVPPALIAAAPRLHSGLRADEFPAILQKGETVIPRGRGSGAPGGTKIEIVMNNDFRGVDPASVARIESKLAIVERNAVTQAVAAVDNRARTSRSYLRARG